MLALTQFSRSTLFHSLLSAEEQPSLAVRAGRSSLLVTSRVSLRPASRPAQARDNYHSTLKALKSKNRTPKKWLGQHYMVNEEINKELVKTASIEKNDLVLEIGPGTGALTKCLVEAGAHIIAVEKDAAMADLVIERFQGNNQVQVIHEDFMKWHVRKSVEHARDLLFAKGVPSKRAKVVSNLPFNITTAVIKRILPMGDIFSYMVLLLQDETASRLVDACPKMNEYRPASLFVHFFSDPQYELKVSRNNFFPRPNVDAAVASFRIKKTSEYPCVASTKSFFTMVNSAFGGKRKMLRNSLQHLYSSANVREALESLDLLDTARPDELSLHQFVALYNALCTKVENPCIEHLVEKDLEHSLL